MMYRFTFLLILTSAIFSSLHTSIYAQETEYIVPITQDVYLSEQHPTMSPYLKRDLAIGQNPILGLGRSRSYFKYGQVVPTPDQIKSATLRVYQYRPIGSSFTIKLMEPQSEWEHNRINWISQPDLLDRQTESVAKGIKGWVEIDLTSLIKEQLTQLTTSRGFSLVASDELVEGGMFWSIDCPRFTDNPICESAHTPHILIYACEQDCGSPDIPPDLPPDSPDTPEEPTPELPPVVPPPVTQEESEPTDHTPQPAPVEPKPPVKLQPVVKAKAPDLAPSDDSISNLIQRGEILGAKIESDRKSGLPIEKSNHCLVKYHLKSKRHQVDCELDAPMVEAITTYYNGDDGYWITVSGSFNRIIEFTLNEVSCVSPTLLNPSTFFRCIEQLQSSKRIRAVLTGRKLLTLDGDEIVEYQGSQNGSSYRTTFSTAKQVVGENRGVRYKGYFSLLTSDGNWLDLKLVSELSDTHTIPAPQETPFSNSDSEKPFIFPFAKYVGVNQWFGKTAYSTFHTGIDFGVHKLPIVASADGVVGFAGWDSYLGECNSGGNTLRISHEDGRNTVYFHLDMIGTEQRPLKKGDRVSKGEVIGKTGNSGKFNCQPLGYHLHLETRRATSQATATDPVPLVDVDWMMIPTLHPDLYPGRLTGNNPHPGH